MTKKRKQRRAPGDDAGTAEAASDRGGRDEQGEVLRGNTTPNGVPNGGPHLELGRIGLETWSKYHFSIAETTLPTYLYTYLSAGLVCKVFHGAVLSDPTHERFGMS